MDVITLLEDLMRIESHESVAEIQTFLLDTIAEAKQDETGCIVAEKSGTGSGPRIILNSHMDVVSPHIPFKRDNDVIRGRGACDAKGCLAPMIAAFAHVSPDAGSVTLIISPDEETTQHGLHEYLSGGIRGDMAIVGEPSGLDLCPSACGHYDLEVSFHGIAAHGATPESGLNATACLAEAVKRLECIDHLSDPVLGKNSFTPTIAQAGNLPNQVPDYASLTIDYRTIPAESKEDALSTIEDAINGIECDFEIGHYERGSSLNSFRTDPEEPLITILDDCTTTITGRSPDIRPFDAATEAAFFAPHMSTVVFGPGLIADGDRAIAHSEREYVPVEEVNAAAEILRLFLDQQLT